MDEFDFWMEIVDLWVQRIAGVSYLDLPDYPYREVFDAGIPAEEAAAEALVAAGWAKP